MSYTVISIENLSKQYRLGQIGTGSIAHDINRWWHRVRGKDDPYLRIGDENDRTKRGASEYVWALQDINFQVKQGELLGIIGKNGAGKSTLLKILSKTTSPTKGCVKIKGRVASLLEVGTGFHPELSGRENIFLNGAILGMTTGEIRRKFDEIVDFAGVERYIDTPVKRYSSGMYVRLAFAVAAHLEPEILIVDEVLAVGDAEFQKKCLGKMQDVSSKEGRTVLFVSHNLTAVNTLCNTAIYMKNGRIAKQGNALDVIELYSRTESEIVAHKKWRTEDKPGDDVAEILEARLIDKNRNAINMAHTDQEMGVEFIYRVKKQGSQPVPNIHVFNMQGENVFVSAEKSNPVLGIPGTYTTVMWIPGHLLNDGRYLVGLAASTLIPEKIHFYMKDALIFDVVEDMDKRDVEYRGKMPGVIRPKLNWETIKLD
jgi:lipopolysaccharide transport system ATP-binding protein